MGFDEDPDLIEQRERLSAAIVSSARLSRFDWTRALLFVEIMFASDVIGAGVEWPAVMTSYDEEALRLLRQVQRKLVGETIHPHHWAHAVANRPVIN
jgi:hypothetical protein